jgi:cytochrome b561
MNVRVFDYGLPAKRVNPYNLLMVPDGALMASARYKVSIDSRPTSGVLHEAFRRRLHDLSDCPHPAQAGETIMASASSTRLRYGNVAMTLHWLIALLIIGNLCSGIWFGEFMDRHDPLRFTVIQIHKSFGLTILMLSLIRLGWRLINPVPALPPAMGRLMRFLARGTHFLFYFLIIAIPLSGWLIVSSSPTGVPTLYFFLFHWPNLPFFNGMLRADKVNYTETFATAHIIMAYLTIALLFLHVGAALYHHFIRRDNVLRRMWFGTNVEGTAR